MSETSKPVSEEKQETSLMIRVITWPFRLILGIVFQILKNVLLGSSFIVSILLWGLFYLRQGFMPSSVEETFIYLGGTVLVAGVYALVQGLPVYQERVFMPIELIGDLAGSVLPVLVLVVVASFWFIGYYTMTPYLWFVWVIFLAICLYDFFVNGRAAAKQIFLVDPQQFIGKIVR